MSFLTGGIVQAAGQIASDLITTDKERLDAEIEMRKVDASLSIAQAEVNKAEAVHASVFVAGWRPGVGWTGVAALAYQFVLYPLMLWAWNLAQALGWLPAAMPAPPLIDTEALWVILSGMLGIAGARTFEKVKGVAR